MKNANLTMIKIYSIFKKNNKKCKNYKETLFKNST